MTTTSDIMDQAGSRGGVHFADDDAAALLLRCVDMLEDPAAHGCTQVKQNASRTIWRTIVDGREIYIKHFHCRSLSHRIIHRLGASHARREAKFSLALAAAAVPTPRVLAWRASKKHWLCTLGVTDCQAGDVWHEQQLAAGDAGRQKIRLATRELASLVGQMHRQGVVHCDLHLGNVLVRDVAGRLELVLMDLHRMKHRSQMSRRMLAANLAQLLHDRMEFTTRTDRVRFLKHYLDALKGGGRLRGWQVMIENLARPHSRRQYANRDRRVHGDGRYFTHISLGNGWSARAVLSSKFAMGGSKAAKLTFTPQQWREVLADPDALTQPDAGTDIVKQSASGIVLRRKLRVGPHELDVFIKRPLRKQKWKILLDCFRSARAVRAFVLGHELLNRRIATALPLACLERRIGPVLLDSILITESVDAAKLKIFLNTWLATPPKGDLPLTVPQQRQLVQQVLWQMGRMLQRLHDHDYSHRDLKSNNLLVRWSPGENPEIVLVDLDGLKPVWYVTERRRYQGLMRLNVSLLECPVVNHAGRLRMLLGYLRRPGSGRVNFKPYWRTLEVWSAKKLKQQIRSRQSKQRATRAK